MKRVIVTGANGFVGRNLVNVLIERGMFVYAVDLQFDTPHMSSWAEDMMTYIDSSCEDLPALDADALIHAAFITASPEARNESPEANLRANLDPTLAMMTYADHHNIKRSIFVSSTAVYRSSPDAVLDETVSPTPLGTYSVAKTLMEHMTDTLKTLHGRDICTVRLGNIYGQHEYKRESRPYLSIIGQMLYSALNDHEIILQYPAEIREWTYATDIGKAIYALLTTDTLNHALYNLAAGQRKSNLEIAKLIQTIIPEIEIIQTDPTRPTLTRHATPD
ncbi:MAG: NAD-dependent epimerase/dehydratase family protein, partial [Aggregatilineales bacterium]